MAARIITLTGETDFGDQDVSNIKDATIDGNLTVKGTTTTIETTNTVISDKLIELANGTTGTPSGDAGVIVERGSSDNAGLIWDESADAWVACTTAATGASSGDLTITPANISAGGAGIGTVTPRRTVDILNASDPQLRVSQADDTIYADVQVKGTTGGVHITPTGGTYAGHAFLKSATTSSYLVVQNSSTGTSDDRGKGLSMGVGANVAYIWMRGTGSNGTLNIGAGGSGGLTMDASNNIVALEGSFQLKAEIAAPSAPAANEGGIFYVKDDGIPYFISDTTAETSLVGGGGGATSVTLSQTTVTGTTQTLVGSVYLTAKTYGTVRCMLGEQNAAHTASLKLTRFTGGSTLHTFTSSSAPANVTTSNLVVGNADWYDIYLYTNNAAGIAVCSGIQFD